MKGMVMKQVKMYKIKDTNHQHTQILMKVIGTHNLMRIINHKWSHRSRKMIIITIIELGLFISSFSYLEIIEIITFFIILKFNKIKYFLIQLKINTNLHFTI